ncbi:Vacuolar membrane protein PEP3 [Spathaspora sp. JA1]|nr:Vacuolar membrane protein PEP3 [Spathaspora sp. JA1]
MNNNHVDDSTSTYTSTSLDHQHNQIVQQLHQPNFEIEPVQLQFDLNYNLQHLLVCNNFMFLVAETDGNVYKINLNNPTQVNKYHVETNGKKITGAWLHPNGQHLIIQLDYINYYYLYESYTNFKPLVKLKGVQINQLVFAKEVNDAVFVGSASEGHVYLGLIKPHNDLKKRDDKFFKQVYKVNGEVQGISIDNQINIITNGHLYTWDYFDCTYSELTKVFKTNATIVSIIKGDVFETNGNEFILVNSNNGQFYTNDEKLRLSHVDNINPTPSSFLLTNHHLIGLTNSDIFIFNKLKLNTTRQLSLKDYIVGKVLGITADYKSNTYWIYTNNSIYELVIQNESISIWYDYYKLGRYNEALSLLEDQENTFFQRDLVLIKQGYDYLTKGGFGIDQDDQDLFQLQLTGIKILAKSTEPFEKICLMLLESSSLQLLVEYLLIKFNMAKMEYNKIRMIVLSSWIIELQLRLDKDDQLEQFIKVNYKHFDKETIFQIMTDLNCPAKLINYAELIQDYQFILKYYINKEDWTNSIKTLIKIYTTDSYDLIYEYSTILLLNYPKVTIETWLRFTKLDYEKLLPSILSYCKQQQQQHSDYNSNYAIQFLQKVIYDLQGYKIKQLNNHYLSLLLQYKDSTKSVIKFINFTNNYDTQFILRLCINHKQYHPAIIILLELNLFEQALELALSNDLINLGEFVLIKYEEYIKRNTQEQQQPEAVAIKLESANYNTHKKLILQFSKHLIDWVYNGKPVGIPDIDEAKENKLNKVLGYILELTNVISLKDLLPLFPENIMINNFKQEIIKTMNEYNSKINQLVLEMNESLTISNKLKHQLKQGDNGRIYSIIEPGEPCKICNNLLISKKFIYFNNCHHGIHKDCLIRYYFKQKNNYKFKKIYANYQKNDVKQELDELLLQQCVVCNEININTIDLGLIDEKDDQGKQWEL